MFSDKLLLRAKNFKLDQPISIFNVKGSNADLYLYNVIGQGFSEGSISASDVIEYLNNCNSKTLNVHINSPGGDVFDGIAIHSTLTRFKGKKNVYIDGIAASIASVIAMAGDTIIMAAGTEMMVHEAHTITVGNAADLRKTADRLEQANSNIRSIYAARTKCSDEKLQQLMSEETFMPVAQCLELGFADQLEESGKPNPMNVLKAMDKKTLSDIELARYRRNLVEKLK